VQTVTNLRTARARAGLTQLQLASRLRVTQAYLSMLERGLRLPSPALARRLARELDLSPVSLPLQAVGVLGADALARGLAGLGYPGLAYLKPRRWLNPAVLLLGALENPRLEGRLVEALPWVPFRYSDLDWGWLLARAKQHDLQNRLGFVVRLAFELATRRHSAEAAAKLEAVLQQLSRAKLAREDTLSEGSMTDAERRWLREHRPPAAAEWNLLSDLTSEQLLRVD
jgi:transcriptional regulator with XRE-family HTH domain